MADDGARVVAAPAAALEIVEETASTNALLRARAASGDERPAWVMARRQIAGRGREGRPWVSLEGNLFLSGLLAVEAAPAHLGRLALAIGVAAHEAIAPWTGQEGLALKWPNDVRLGRRKIAGALIETWRSDHSPAMMVCVGLGVNIQSAPQGLDQACAAIAEASSAPPAPEILARLVIERFQIWADAAFSLDFAQLRSAWLARAEDLGAMIQARIGGEKQAGRFVGLNEEGALLLATEAGMRILHAGEVV